MADPCNKSGESPAGDSPRSLGTISMDKEIVFGISERIYKKYCEEGYPPEEYPSISRRCIRAIQTGITIARVTTEHLQRNSIEGQGKLDKISQTELKALMPRLCREKGYDLNSFASAKLHAVGHIAEVGVIIESLIHLFQKYPLPRQETNQSPQNPATLLEDIRKIIQEENSELVAKSQLRDPEDEGPPVYLKRSERGQYLWDGPGLPDTGPGRWRRSNFLIWQPTKPKN